MKPLYVLLVGVAVGWAASGVDWSRDAVAQDGGVGAQEGESVQGESGGGPQRPFPHSAEATAAEGTIPVPQPNGYRYQFFGVGKSSIDSAYYIFDAKTGRVWHGNQGMKAKLIADVGDKTN